MELLSQAEQAQSLAMAARKSWGQWIWDSQNWDHFATLTFKPPRNGGSIGPRIARRKFHDWMRALHHATSHGSHLGFFVGQEFGPRTGRLHYHALLAGTLELPPELLALYWDKNGFSQVGMAKPASGPYIAKYTTKDAGSQYCNWNFPRHWSR